MSQPQFDWDAVRLFYCECRSYKKTAEHFGLKLESVKSRAKRGHWGGLIDASHVFQGASVQAQGASPHPQGAAGPVLGGREARSGCDLPPLQGTSPGCRGAGQNSDEASAGCKGATKGGEGRSLQGATPLSSTPAIPANINSWSKLEAAHFYHGHLGWAIHQLYAFDQGTPKERGKKPLLPGWRQHKAADVSPEDIESGFGRGSRYNLGVILRPPFVAVDLDSKSDDGESVRTWLASRPEFAALPRERTASGVHIHFRCPDLPETVLTHGKAITTDLTSTVTAELYVNGLNLVLSPSIHKTKHRYTWEVTGEIPEVKWADLVRWFGFAAPVAKGKSKPGRRSRNWRAAYRGDVASLDLAALFREAGMLGECLDPDQGKWAVRCPWESSHSGGPNEEPGSDTAIFVSGSLGFRCLHAHCHDRSLEDVCLWFECRDPGSVDRLCARLRPDIAAASVGEDEINDIWQEGANAADVVARHGDPFVWRADRFSGDQSVADFNLHYWATRYACETLLLYDPYAGKFYHYHDRTGLWRWVTEHEVRGDLSTYLLGHSRRLGQPILDTGRTAERLASMTGVLKAQSARRMAFKRNGDVIHLANGMLHIDSDPLVLRQFAPGYFSLRSCPVTFDEEALCPRFLRELVLPAMGREDAELLQLMGGLFLTGRNSWQKILVFCGTGGSGKGTIARILQRLVGMQHVKQLRTRLLDDRFELDNLDQATLLVGSDVEGDFLSCRGAKVIKALTGGDPLTVETKGGGKRDITGEHNVLITCNDRLQVRLDGDESAWKRRLLIIDFNRPAVRQIDDFDRVLFEEEGSGIFNFFLVGAARLKEIAHNGGGFPITPAQEDRVERLLAESDSLRLFVKQGIVREEGGSLTTDEILYAYENFCSEHNWTALPKRRFELQLGPLMMEFHRAGKRNDIARGSSDRRGFRHVRLAGEEATPPEATAPEPASLLPE